MGLLKKMSTSQKWILFTVILIMLFPGCSLSETGWPNGENLVMSFGYPVSVVSITDSYQLGFLGSPLLFSAVNVLAAIVLGYLLFRKKINLQLLKVFAVFSAFRLIVSLVHPPGGAALAFPEGYLIIILFSQARIGSDIVMDFLMKTASILVTMLYAWIWLKILKVVNRKPRNPDKT